MTPKKVHCFFEQSGTFKNEFIKLGIPFEDYDILDDFGETDHVMDLYAEIKAAHDGNPSIFDSIGPDELIIAFFPCIRFENQSLFLFTCKNKSMKTWSDVEKLEYAVKMQEELTELYKLISYLVEEALKRKIPLIIENPYSTQHYLTQRWPLIPKVIDRDRRDRGDKFKKPTQYWFINIEPSYNMLFEPQIMWDDYGPDVSHCNPGADRSLITHEYADRFIREFIL